MERAVKDMRNRRFLLRRFKNEWDAAQKSVELDGRRARRREVIKATGVALGLTILGMAAVCGILVVGAVAPNVFSAFGRFGRHRRYFSRDDFEKKLNHFKRRGYVAVVEHGDSSKEIRLTKLGEDQLVRRAFGNFKVLTREKWDGRWRIVIFDVLEKHRWARDGLRKCLKNMGFCQFQKSVFAYPYPCREEIEFLRRLYDLGGHLRYIETDMISFDEDLKKFFGLL